MTKKLLINSIIGLLALYIGYPLIGSGFMVLMAPYVTYMVLKKDASFLPALVLHCASNTTIVYYIFVLFVFVAIRDYRYYDKQIRIFLGILLGIFPFFILLLLQRILLFGDKIGPALDYIGFYISLFAFFYGLSISRSFTPIIAKGLYYVLAFAFLVSLFGSSSIITLGCIYVSAGFVIKGFTKRKFDLQFLFALFVMLVYLLNSQESTFSILFVICFVFALILLYNRNRIKSIKRMTGIMSYAVVVIILTFGIYSYMRQTVSYDVESIDITSLSNLTTRAKYKLFEDRAPFWAGGLDQIVQNKHLIPITEVKDINYVRITGEEGKASFGSHTTFIELIRRFGILIGGLVIICYIGFTIVSRQVFTIRNINSNIICFFTMAYAVTIVYSLTGTQAMMANFSLLTFGVMGIGYQYYKDTLCTSSSSVL